MDPEETTVETQENEAAADDALQESLVEETEESESLDSVMAEDNGDQESKPAEESEPQSSGTNEPGWIRKRVDKAVQKAVEATEARMRAEFEQQMAPFRERLLTEEARELVRKGTVKDLETAKELVRYRQGLQPETKKQAQSEQPRDDKGQFAPNRRDPALQARIDMLSHQADTIKAKQGIDVTQEFTDNEEVKQKVVSGEWDFYDVAEDMAKRQANKKKAPAPMRTPNGASGSEKSTIASMSDEQFDRLEKRISGGARYNI